MEFEKLPLHTAEPIMKTPRPLRQVTGDFLPTSRGRISAPFPIKKAIVYVEWAFRVNFATIFGDLYQNKLWVICNNLNQFAHLSSASGPSNDVIKMAVIVLLMYTYKTSYLKQ